MPSVLELRVIAAAIKCRKGVVHYLPPPARHRDVIGHVILKAKSFPKEEGFLISDGSFAGRALAKVIASHAHQLLPHASHDGGLNTEEVW